MNFHRSCLAVMLFATMIAVGSAFADCSDASVKGAYGVSLAGSFNGEPSVIVGQFVFDGEGKVTFAYTISTNGGIGHQSPISTFYGVKANCTGNINLTFDFVLDNNNKGFQMVFDYPPSRYSGYGVAQDASNCSSHQGMRTFAASLSGMIVGAGDVGIIGPLNIDGNGNITGSGTGYLLTGSWSGSITGTYTRNANCTGTAKITPQGLGPMTFNTVEVNNGKEVLLIETDNRSLVTGTLQQ